ncbi:MAG: hypothetical protein ABR598_05020 [Candidatus Dormibacteria bacterium]
MPPVELGFWRTLYRYLLSIVASLACGAAWYFFDIRVLHLGALAITFTGVLALALGFFLMGYLWLSLDVGRPAPEGVDEEERNTQLFLLWMGIPLGVVAVCGVFALVAVVLAGTVLRSGIPAAR